MARTLCRIDTAIVSNRTSSSVASQDSTLTQSTAPTSHEYESRPSFKPLDREEKSGADEGFWDHSYAFDPRASTETYASTVDSAEDLDDDDDGHDDPEFAVPDLPREAFGVEPIPSTPPEFADLFPSNRRLLVRHDDTTEDGNMNLRVDTEDLDWDGRRRAFTLFHLRMYDLRDREFSLRRYCRDSGRELCHSSRRGATTPALGSRTTLPRSMTNALASLRGKPSPKTTASGALQRQDSGYHSDDGDSTHETSGRAGKAARRMLPTNTIRLEFSNYAHVSVKRRGTTKSKRYEWDYWGRHYTWKRRIAHDGVGHEISYHLFDHDGAAMAHIVPIPLTPREARLEETKGGWVPPCSMWIGNLKESDRLAEVADLIVATGLMALVDDSIKRRFHHRRTRQVIIPLPSSSAKVSGYIGPKRLIDEVFHRQIFNKRQQTPARQTPMRQGSSRS